MTDTTNTPTPETDALSRECLNFVIDATEKDEGSRLSAFAVAYHRMCVHARSLEKRLRSSVRPTPEVGEVFCCESAEKMHHLTDPSAPVSESFCGVCAVCGCDEKYTYHVPESLWRKVLPKPLWESVVCAKCFHNMVAPNAPFDGEGEPSQEEVDEAFAGVRRLLELKKRLPNLIPAAHHAIVLASALRARSSELERVRGALRELLDALKNETDNGKPTLRSFFVRGKIISAENALSPRALQKEGKDG